MNPVIGFQTTTLGRTSDLVHEHTTIISTSANEQIHYKGYVSGSAISIKKSNLVTVIQVIKRSLIAGLVSAMPEISTREDRRHGEIWSQRIMLNMLDS